MLDFICYQKFIYRRFDSVLGTPVISNFSYYTENTLLFLDYQLQPLAKKVESYIKDTTCFLKQFKELDALSKKTIVCICDVIGLCPNVPHKDGLASIRKPLYNRQIKEVTTNTLAES